MTDFDIRQPIVIKSAVHYRVVMNDKTTNLRREWMQKGAIQRIPYDQLETAYYRNGTQSLFEEGILFIDNEEARQRLGLENPAAAKFIEDETIKKLLTEAPMSRFKKELSELTTAQANEVARLAIQMEITNTDKMDELERVTGIDVRKSIQKVIDDKKRK